MSESQPPTIVQSNLPAGSQDRPNQILVLQQATQPAEEFSLADGIRFLHRHRLLILGWGLGLGIAGAAASYALITPVFEAEALLKIDPPPTDLKTGNTSLNVPGYQRLVENDSVIAEVRARLITEGTISADASLQIGNQLKTASFLSKKDESVAVAPYIQLIVRDANAERAATIANVWTEVFLQRVHAMNVGGTKNNVAVTESQFQQQRIKLSNAEDIRAKFADETQMKQSALLLEWERKITDAIQDAARTKADYLNETKRLVESFPADKNLEVRTAIVEASREGLQLLQTEKVGIKSRLEQRSNELATSKTSLVTIPKYLVTRKTISDDATWQAIVSGKMTEEERKKFLSQGMISETPNPEYDTLSSQITKLEIEVASLIPREGKLEEDIKAKSVMLQKDEIALRRDKASFDELKRTREIGVQALIENADLKIVQLKRERDIVVEGYKRQTDNRLAILDRDIAEAKTQYAILAKQYSDGQIAQFLADRQDIHLAAPAVAPTKPQSSKRTLFALGAAFFGVFLGLGHAVVRNAIRPKG